MPGVKAFLEPLSFAQLIPPVRAVSSGRPSWTLLWRLPQLQSLLLEVYLGSIHTRVKRPSAFLYRVEPQSFEL